MFGNIPKRNTQVPGRHRLFFDYAATTPVSTRVLRAMTPFFQKTFANPSSLHREGVAAKQVLTDMRKRVARVLSVKARDVYFTAGGTESINMGLFGVMRCAQKNNTTTGVPHILITAIEHPAVQSVAMRLEQEGCRVSVVPVNEHGIVDVHTLRDMLTVDTVVVAVMCVNNEIGTIQPLREVHTIIADFKKKLNRTEQSYPYLYTDASQAVNHLSVQVEKLGVDMMTLDSSKFYGPKGVGVLYAKQHITMESLLVGGNQESGMRAGTENIPGIVGFTTALEEATTLRERETRRMEALRAHFIETMQRAVPASSINGAGAQTVPNIINICVPGLHAEFAVLQLDARGIACAATTACKSNDETGESYVVRALGDVRCAASSLRFSFGRDTTKKSIDTAIPAIISVCTK